MDLSKLSDSDLQQIAKGDLRMVSSAGLKLMAGEQEVPKEQDLGTKAINGIAKYMYDKANTGFGAVRGAAGIGATIAQPFQAIAGGALGNNAEMRSNLDTNLQRLGADPTADTYQGGKLSTEIGLTLPIGGAIGNGAKALGLDALGNSIASGGFSLGRSAAPAFSGQGIANAGLRIAGGGINAGATTLAATGSPDDAIKGAGIGMAIPVVGKVAGELGGGISNLSKKIIKPLTTSGRQEILTDNLINMLGDKASIAASKMANAKGYSDGFKPLAGQVADSHELAAFSRMFQNRNAGLMQPAIDAQRASLASAANSLGGDDLERIALVNARNDAASKYYDAGKNAMIESTPQLDELLKRPAINQAYKAAEFNGMNRGKQSIIDDKILSGKLYQDEAPQAISKFSRPDLLKGEKIGGGEGKNIVQQIRKMGGLNLGHIKDITGEKTGRAARAPVGFFNKNGLGVDDVAQQLDELGYIPKDEMRVDGGVQYVKDAVGEQLKGNKIYAQGDEPFYAPDYYGTKTIEHNNPIRGDVGDYSVNPVYSGKTLQEIKFALDAAKKFNPSASIGERMTQQGVLDASNAFNNYLSDVVPEIRKGDAIYADMSKPINQMDIGNAIRDKFIPAMQRDNPIPSQLNYATLAKTVRDSGDTLAKQITGFRGATLANSTSPKQQAILNRLLKDSELVNAGNQLGSGINSSTYQHLAYDAKGENSGLVDGLLGTTKTGKVLGAIKNLSLSATGSIRKLDSQMADILMNPNTTGAQIQARLAQLSQPKRESIVKLLAQKTSKVAPVGLLELSQ